MDKKQETKEEKEDNNTKIVIGVVILSLFICCCILIICFTAGIALYNSQSTGNLRVSSYTETNPDFSDPTQVDVKINSIFSIKPAVDGKSVFVTDEKGFVELELPVGEYELAPLYGSKDSVKEVTITRDTTSKVYLPIANRAIFFLRFNCSEDSPFDDLGLRQDISGIINRKNLVSRLSISSIAKGAYNFIPEEYSFEEWSETAQIVEESGITSKIPVPQNKKVDFRMLANITPTDENQKFLRVLSADLRKLEKIDDIEPVLTSWDSYIARNDSGKFEVSKMAWVYDSNNILDFYEEFLGDGADFECMSDDIDKLIDEGFKAIRSGDVEKYEEIVVEINDQIIDDVPIVPLYYYDVLDNVLDFDFDGEDIPNVFY